MHNPELLIFEQYLDARLVALVELSGVWSDVAVFPISYSPINVIVELRERSVALLGGESMTVAVPPPVVLPIAELRRLAVDVIVSDRCLLMREVLLVEVLRPITAAELLNENA